MRAPSGLHCGAFSSNVPVVTWCASAGCSPLPGTAAETVQMWECSVGSTHPSSSARYSACTMTRTSLFGSSVFSFFFFSRSSGVVELVNAIVFPSGDHAAADAPLGRSVSCWASPPASDST